MATLAAEVNAFGQDKIARYGWKVTSEEGAFERVNKRLLHINTDDYQREGTKAKILELSKGWSWIACGTLTVARRDGVLWVVDGGHRKCAADNRSDIKTLPCMIFDVEDIEQEAKAFLATNRNRKPMSALAAFKAKLTANDVTAKFVDDVVRDCGLRFATASSEARDFKAVAMATSMAADDPDAFVVVMQTAADLVIAEGRPLHQRLLSGLSYLHRNIDGGLDNPRIKKRLAQIGAGALMKAADSAAAYYSKGGAKVYADGMLQAINKGLRTRFEFGESLAG